MAGESVFARPSFTVPTEGRPPENEQKFILDSWSLHAGRLGWMSEKAARRAHDSSARSERMRESPDDPGWSDGRIQVRAFRRRYLIAIPGVSCDSDYNA